MYYHPEWQRKYIYDLIDYTSKINPENLRQIEGINVTFLTHSPFILSDIPTNNLIRLKDGKPYLINEPNTFGANIHELLKHSFFFEHGVMGEFAKNKVEEIILKLNLLELINTIKLIEKDSSYPKEHNNQKVKLLKNEIQQIINNTFYEKLSIKDLEELIISEKI